MGQKELTDLSAFEEGIGQLPGTYRVDVIVNKTSVGVRNIDFVTHKNAQGESTLQPCLSIDMLREFGIRTEAFPRLAANGDCANLSAIPRPAQNLHLSASNCCFLFLKPPSITSHEATSPQSGSTQGLMLYCSTTTLPVRIPKRALTT